MKEDSHTVGRYVIGVLVGVLLTYFYVRFGYTLPGVMQLGGKVAGEAVVTTAEIDLYNPKAPHDVRQRALAVVVGQNPDLFIEVDEAIGNQFFDEVLRRKAERKAKLLKHRLSAYDMALSKPALREMYERRFGTSDLETLKRRMLIDDIRDDEFLHGYLSRRFPDATSSTLAEIVLDVYRTGLRPKAAVASREVRTVD